MKIGVFLKQVPATDAQIRIADPNAGIVTTDIAWIINPYDEFALEEGLKLKDAGKATEVVVFTVGGADCEARIREAFARGADRAVRLDDPAFAGSDSLGLARILAAAVKAEGIELVLAGKTAIDDDNAQVPAMVAELLGWPQVGGIGKLELDGRSFQAWRDRGGEGADIVGGNLPVMLTADKRLNTPRSSSLKGIMAAKKKTVEVKGLAALGLAAAQVGAGAALVQTRGWSPPPQRPAGRILKGSPSEQVKELVHLLRTEAKVL